MNKFVKKATDAARDNAKWLLLIATAGISLAINHFEEKEQQEAIDRAVEERMNALMAGNNPDESEEPEEDAEDDSDEESEDAEP